MQSAIALIMACWTLASATAQCTNAWVPGPVLAAVPPAPSGALSTVAWDPDGSGPLSWDAIFGGAFTSVGGVAANNIVAWNPTSGAWSPLGAGLNNWVRAMTPIPNGDLVVGGLFTLAGGTPANHIARWDGSTWSAMGAGFAGDVYALLALPSGDIIAGGLFVGSGGTVVNNVARWDGTAWVPMGAGMNGAVRGLSTTSDGDVVAVGYFTTAGTASAAHVARWNGSAWFPIGAGVGAPSEYLTCVERMPNGDIMVGGTSFLVGGHNYGLARWDGATWTGIAGFTTDLLDSGSVLSLALVPGGDLVVGGHFSYAGNLGNPYSSLARWNNGWIWPWPSDHLGAPNPINLWVYCLAATPGGSLLVGGRFQSVGTQVAGGIAELDTTCQATIASYGVGCTGPGGALSLVADSLPWMQDTFQVTALGLGPASFGLMMISFSQVQPGALPLNPNLVGILPGPGVGCDLLVGSMDIAGLMAPALAPSQSYQLSLAPDPTLPGLTFYMQAAELDFSSGWVGTYSTNALTCTVGAF